MVDGSGYAIALVVGVHSGRWGRRQGSGVEFCKSDTGGLFFAIVSLILLIRNS